MDPSSLGAETLFQDKRIIFLALNQESEGKGAFTDDPQRLEAEFLDYGFVAGAEGDVGRTEIDAEKFLGQHSNLNKRNV